MANSKNNETYTEEFRNTVRIIKILIDIGKKELKECFPIFIDKANSYSNKKYKDKTELFQEILNNPNENLFDLQRDKLKKGDIAKFDITLFALVYRHILKHQSKEFKYIKKIKDIRNECFGHIYQVGSDSSELESLKEQEEPPKAKDFPKKGLVKILTYAFIGLIQITHSDPNKKINDLREKIRKCLIDTLEPSAIERYREQISNLIAQDGETKELILRKISSLNIPSINELVAKGNKQNSKNFEDVKQHLKNIFAKLKKENHDLVDIMKSIDDRLENIHRDVLESTKKIEMARSEIIDISNENKKMIISTVQENTNDIIDEIRNCLPKREYKNSVCINLHDYDAYFRNEEDILRFFKILILDSSNFDKETIKTDSFLPVLANFDWNIIIDLNQNENFSSFICQH